MGDYHILCRPTIFPENTCCGSAETKLVLRFYNLIFEAKICNQYDVYFLFSNIWYYFPGS